MNAGSTAPLISKLASCSITESRVQVGLVLDVAVDGVCMAGSAVSADLGRVATSDATLPWMAAPSEAARKLFNLLDERLVAGGGLHVFVTHDAVLAPFVSRALGLSHVLWPDFLAAAVLWRDAAGARLWFDGRQSEVANGVRSNS